MSELQQFTSQNQRAWEEIADIRHQKWLPAAYYAQGGVRLGERLLAVAGDVRGLTLCHLQCATGEDALSWHNRGAEVTGVDISPRQIELAREKAAAAGLAVAFIAADIYDLPSAFSARQFDLVFTGGGALVWLPDLQRWAQTVAQLLKPGGRLLLEEEHPVAECLVVEEGQVRLVGDYFRRNSPEVFTGWHHFAGGEDAVEENYQFTWPLGDTVTALAQAGLLIELLEEQPSQSEWRFGEQLSAVGRLPGEYLLVARKPTVDAPA